MNQAGGREKQNNCALMRIIFLKKGTQFCDHTRWQKQPQRNKYCRMSDSSKVLQNKEEYLRIQCGTQTYDAVYARTSVI
jgi:hypothetical protein